MTIIGAAGKVILQNHIFKTPAGTEGSGEGGQLAIDMSPTQPHTMTKNARSCESCHASDKALGLGTSGTRPWNVSTPGNYQNQTSNTWGLSTRSCYFPLESKSPVLAVECWRRNAGRDGRDCLVATEASCGECSHVGLTRRRSAEVASRLWMERGYTIAMLFEYYRYLVMGNLATSFDSDDGLLLRIVHLDR